ncbi:O-methylsterigmatocystin oxidoreductase OS=Aspergillus parasiticus GN=ordA PE=3 SV=1 [Rhizoctonia solani AG-1 IB]|uniref:O-methylsterigmatocystin oxidoreductase n=1 Tax=Thanatephorus cucumeris (strain AG1-IB / isolate 7/3/14) TaxID=1108050 RepID=A0A0B7FZ20_THACB|nr:O-methylsterigmatocystin oxidoreductase OS=Aspergillus parasiticus GN=ordA PE=3 SV=1 [Rhizoctonia solani AG-1 IB]
MELATSLLDKHTPMTSDRPREVMINELLGWGNSPAFRNHDETHKKMRRVLASALHPSAARSYGSQHVDTALGLLRKLASNPASFMESTDAAIGAFTVRLAYGYTLKQENDPILSLVHNAIRYLVIAFSNHWLVNDFPLCDYIEFTCTRISKADSIDLNLVKSVPSWFPGATFQKIGKKGYELRTRYVDTMFNMVQEQVRKGQVEQPSYVSGLLESKGGANANSDDIYLIKWTGASIFTAGTTTTSSVIKAFFLMTCLYPEAAKKAQAEIDSAVGRDRIPGLQDRLDLPYTDAFVQEIMRMYPPAPLGLSHLATEEIEFQGYRIPKGATINANIWAILRDPNHFSSPHIFNPSRFLGPNPEPDPRKFIFGFGRRVCPGLHVANNSTWVICTALLSVFDIRPGQQLTAKLAKLGGRESDRLYELTEPYGSGDPLPFDCDIKPRDAAAVSLLDNST